MTLLRQWLRWPRAEVEVGVGCLSALALLALACAWGLRR